MSIKFKTALATLALPVMLLAIFVLIGSSLWLKKDKTPDLPEPPLKVLAEQKGIKLGNFAIPKLLNERPYRQILTEQFEFGLVDNQPNWSFTDYELRPSPERFDFSRIDEVVRFAEAHDMPLQFHHFLWGEEKWLPRWLKEGNYTKAELLDLIEDHIMTVGQRYRGKAREWTVVNEAFTRNEHVFGLRDWWTDNVGDTSYIDQAFIWARAADPEAKLILNDFGNEIQNTVSDAMYKYIKTAKARGVPIDGVGLQMHIDGTHPPKKDDVIANMKRFAELGVEIYVTEFDINMNDVKTSTSQKDQIEGDIYFEMLRACIESKVCHSFAYLGITDKETWYNYLDLPDPRPLMFDEDYKPKPAYYSTRAALEQP